MPHDCALSGPGLTHTIHTDLTDNVVESKQRLLQAVWIRFALTEKDGRVELQPAGDCLRPLGHS